MVWRCTRVTQATETTSSDALVAPVSLIFLFALNLIVHNNILLEFGASKVKNSTKAHKTGKPSEKMSLEHATCRAPRHTSARAPLTSLPMRVRPRCRPVAPCLCTG